MADELLQDPGSTRRHFIKTGAVLGGAALIPGRQWLAAGSRAFASTQTSQVPLPGANIPKYRDPLVSFVGRRVTSGSFSTHMGEFQQLVLPASVYPHSFRAGTFVWGYKVDSRPPSWPGFTVEAQQGMSTTITYVNNLPGARASHLEDLLTVDQTIHWADPLNTGPSTQPFAGPVPTVVHLHGAEVPSSSDGAPEGWFTADGRHGKGYTTISRTAANAAIYRYPNSQPAATLWFHDHALGITRLNVFSGLAAFYLLRDAFDTGERDNPLGLPAGRHEIELMIQDRQFDTNGQLIFPDGTPTDNPTGLNGTPPNPDIHPFWIPEFFGDAMVVNGKTWPFLDVEPRRYRFRFANGCNARFLSMNLTHASNASSANPPSAVAFWQTGTDGGLLDRPVRLNDPSDPSSLQLFLAPSERADVIIDFAGLEGRTLTLTNGAVFPFPSGGPPDPNVDGQIMQFKVKLPLSGADHTFNPAGGGSLRGGRNQEPAIVRLADPTKGTLGPHVKPSVTRQLILVEVEGANTSVNPGGPLEVLLNNSTWMGMREGTSTPIPGSRPDGAGQGFFMTELPVVGATEVWEILNLTMDAHPLHIHLVQCQVLNRQAAHADRYRARYDSRFPGGTFAGETVNADGTVTYGTVTYPPRTYIQGYGPPKNYQRPNSDGAIGGNPAFSPFLQGPPTLPDANEAGWKDTFKAFPGVVTRIVVRWAPTQTPVSEAKPGQNLFSFDPTVGPGYVWHCHILDHEDNDMMRGYTPVMADTQSTGASEAELAASAARFQTTAGPGRLWWCRLPGHTTT
jgi:spore coat protein A, manganese oxidase